MLGFVDRLLAKATGPVVLGLCGAQGSGKSTLAAAVARAVPDTVILSLDDLYRTRAARRDLAATIHPLFATRGVPGTHDVDLGIATLDALRAGARIRLPRFDKAVDDRVPDGDVAEAGAVRLILFEGWCVGARPIADADLAEPINALERNEDGDGRWRRSWNAALAGSYQALFARVDRLVLLEAPGWETVLRWRTEQEQTLRAAGASGPGVMDDAAVARFIQHYERLTRHILAEMPGRADLVLPLDERRSLRAA
ncbi:AAA family ATPase [uncultured Sphingomonas sp.]|uniref:AAA family ATPase n=1 Tax=uncultured Sphingomonas sp. TaxID=158754 RepID=UPI0025E08849|nr:AAA family ATPase [uncultured Sphingomonas sp.]